MTDTATVDQPWTRERARAGSGEPLPGLACVFSATAPRFAVVPLGRVGPRLFALELGRGAFGDITLDDACLSRRHATVTYDGERWSVHDRDSRNGSAVDGRELAKGGAWEGERPRVVRAGDTLFLPCEDVGRLAAGGVTVSDGVVIGPALHAIRSEAGLAARAGETLYITGESGSGKELVARAFHAAGPHPNGPFVAVSCATLPEGVAERLLFGARRGAYSGASDNVDGHFQAAAGGTLFLDELAELALPVQAKLLRVLETREVQPLGAPRGKVVDFRFCSATHHDLRAAVAAGRFREDLYFRVGRPSVALPPLRERAEEIPWILAGELARGGVGAHVSLVEECLLRPWPGNVRELLVEARNAARTARAAGKSAVEREHLAADAGRRFSATAAEPPDVEPPGGAAPLPDAATIGEALRRENGNVTRAARSLGLHRNQLRRWLAKQEP